jgi:O-antigen ligase
LYGNFSINRKHEYSLALLLILIPFFKPAGLGQVAILDSIFQVWKLFALAVVFLILLGNLRILPFGRIELYLLAFWISYAVGCYQTGVSYGDVINGFFTSMALLLLFRLEGSLGRTAILLRTLSLIFSIGLVLQVLTIFIVRQGIVLFPSEYAYMYFFGEDNYSAFMVLPMMAVVLYTDTVTAQHGWNHRAALLIYFAVLFSYIYVQSIAAILGIGLLGICYACRHRAHSFFRWLTPKRVGAIFLTILVLFLFFNIQDYLAKVFGSFFQRAFDKDILTMNSRTIIWSQARMLIKQRPLFGWGDGLSSSVIWGLHAHNFLLELLVRSGLIGMTAYLLWISSAYRRGFRYMSSESVIVLVGALASFALLSFFDFYINVSAFYCLVAVVAIVPETLGTASIKACSRTENCYQ